jgi:hypothetical protein
MLHPRRTPGEHVQTNSNAPYKLLEKIAQAATRTTRRHARGRLLQENTCNSRALQQPAAVAPAVWPQTPALEQRPKGDCAVHLAVASKHRPLSKPVTCKPKPNLAPRKDAEGGRSAEGRPPWLYTTDAATPQGGKKRMRSGALTSLALLARTGRSMSGRRRNHTTLPGGTSHLRGPARAPSPPAHLHTLQPLPRPEQGAHAGPRDSAHAGPRNSERARHGQALKGANTPGLCSCNAAHARDQKREHKKEKRAALLDGGGRGAQARAPATCAMLGGTAWLYHTPARAPDRALLAPQARDEAQAVALCSCRKIRTHNHAHIRHARGVFAHTEPSCARLFYGTLLQGPGDPGHGAGRSGLPSGAHLLLTWLHVPGVAIRLKQRITRVLVSSPNGWRPSRKRAAGRVHAPGNCPAPSRTPQTPCCG